MTVHSVHALLQARDTGQVSGDPHWVLARFKCACFACCALQVTEEQRGHAKQLTYGLLYGMVSVGLGLWQAALAVQAALLYFIATAALAHWFCAAAGCCRRARALWRSSWAAPSARRAP